MITMNILLIGRETSITNTIEEILLAQEEWKAIKVNATQFPDSCNTRGNSQGKAPYEVVIANLIDFSEKPVEATRLVRTIFPLIPLLVMANYKKNNLIQFLIEAGANGYLQLGLSEMKLLDAITHVAQGHTVIHADYT